jgi:hypothetical protein
MQGAEPRASSSGSGEVDDDAISEIDELLAATQNRLDAALRASRGNPARLRALTKLGLLLTAPSQYSRELRRSSGV